MSAPQQHHESKNEFHLPSSPTRYLTVSDSDEQTTPRSQPSWPSNPVPGLTLSDAPPSSPHAAMPPPPPPNRTAEPRPPSLQPFPAIHSSQRASGPLPNRGRPAPFGSGSGSSGLAPPPTHSTMPPKPSRKVVLAPGHSPLDWARISGPDADLRGVPPSTPYLRVTRSALKRQTGRKGKDVWMALSGKVYNVTPYFDFHPGGRAELMRGAAKDATGLFGEIHPWVNYETMLSACLVGLLVDDGETEGEMDKMD